MTQVTPTQGTVLHAAVDWLTATSKSPIGRAEIAKLGKVAAALEERAGSKQEQWFWQSYVGTHCGAVTFGERTDGAILRISGALASMYWNRALQFTSGVSRLDLAITVFFAEMPNNLAVEGYRAVQRLNAETGKDANAMVIISTDGGQTLTLGKRSSEKYARLYNKEVESKEEHYKGTWRYEVEYKGKQAVQVARRLEKARDPAADIQSLVHTHFADRGVLPLFPYTDGLHRVAVPRSRSNNEKAIAWLASSVAPCIARLREAGLEDELRKALGF